MSVQFSEKQQASAEKLTWDKVMQHSKMPKHHKEALLDLAEISLRLDTYDDLFSDFDPRPYRERSLSTDFIDETSRATRERGEAIELRLMIPKGLRRADHENMIRKRLKEHFKKHYHRIAKEFTNRRHDGITLTVVGALLLVLASYVSYLHPEAFALNLLLTVLEPAGWFISWYGLDKVFYQSKQDQLDLEFYKKMADCHIVFQGY